MGAVRGAQVGADAGEGRVLDEESSDAILVSNRQSDGQKIVFMAGCWPALREAIDRLIAEHRESPE